MWRYLANFGTFFGDFVTKSCKNAPVLSFTYVSVFNNLKSTDMIVTHVGDFHFLKFDRHNKLC